MQFNNGGCYESIFRYDDFFDANIQNVFVDSTYCVTRMKQCTS